MHAENNPLPRGGKMCLQIRHIALFCKVTWHVGLGEPVKKSGLVGILSTRFCPNLVDQLNPEKISTGSPYTDMLDLEQN